VECICKLRNLKILSGVEDFKLIPLTIKCINGYRIIWNFELNGVLLNVKFLLHVADA